MADSALRGYDYPLAAGAAGSPVSIHKGYVYENGHGVHNNTYYTYPDYYDSNPQQYASSSYNPHLARPYPANHRSSTSGTATPPFSNALYGPPLPGDSEKIAVQTPTTEHSNSQPPHSHDGRSPWYTHIINDHAYVQLSLQNSLSISLWKGVIAEQHPFWQIATIYNYLLWRYVFCLRHFWN